MAKRNWANGGRTYSTHTGLTLIDCNFVVDSTNGNGLGIRSLKGPTVNNVFMHTTTEPGLGIGGLRNPNPQGSTGGGAIAGSLNLASSAGFAILAYAAITGSTGAGSIVTGDMGIYPNNLTSITNFPPSTDIGTTHAADGIANQAMIDATAAFTAGQIRGLAGTTIAAELGGVTLTPGDYQSATSFGLSVTTGHSTLTLNGAGTYLLYSPSTIITGTSGSTDIPTIAFAGTATASNTIIEWIAGSSATINQSVSSAGATFYGNVIAQASVTATQSGTINGRLFALTGAVTLSNTNALSLPAGSVATGGGVIVVQLADNYNRSLCGFNAIVAPVSGTSLKIDNTALTAGVSYIITSLGDALAAQWLALGVPQGTTPAVGVSFIAASNGGSANTSTSRVMATAAAGSGICRIETVGDPNLSIAPDPTKNQGFGAQFILQCYDYAGAKTAPVNGTVISLAFLLNSNKI
jgi:hypothetical protein